MHTRRPRPITGRHRAAGATGRPRLHGAGGKTCQVSRAAIRRHPQPRRPRRAPGSGPQGAGSPRRPASSRGRSLRGRSALGRRKAPPTPSAARALQGAAPLREASAGVGGGPRRSLVGAAATSGLSRDRRRQRRAPRAAPKIPLISGRFRERSLKNGPVVKTRHHRGTLRRPRASASRTAGRAMRRDAPARARVTDAPHTRRRRAARARVRRFPPPPQSLRVHGRAGPVSEPTNRRGPPVASLAGGNEEGEAREGRGLRVGAAGRG